MAMTKAVIPAKLLLRNSYRVLRNKSSWDANVVLSNAARNGYFLVA